MPKPLLEIRCSEHLTAAQYEMMSNSLSEHLGKDYDVIVLENGMSAHVHDEAILKELREIKETLTGIKQISTITGRDIQIIVDNTKKRIPLGPL